MTDAVVTPGRQGRRVSALALLLLMQAVATVYFIGDAIGDLVDDPGAGHAVVEGMVAVALLAGLILSARELRRVMSLMADQAQALAVASGALNDVIARQFTDWGLTPAERDVGVLALRGLDVADIALARGAAAGTVRAQLTRIYAKAGVSGRAQFAAWFVEGLMGGGVLPGAAATGAERGLSG